MRAPNYQAWLEKDLWTLDEFVLMACGLHAEPTEQETQTFFTTVDLDDTSAQDFFGPSMELKDIALRSIAVGNLEVVDYGGHFKTAAKPIVFIRWAISRDIELPKEMTDFEASSRPEDARRRGRGANEVLGTPKRGARKAKTNRLYQQWHEKYLELKRKHPGKSDVWCSIRISESKLGGRKNGRKYSPETIRKNMK